MMKRIALLLIAALMMSVYPAYAQPATEKEDITLTNATTGNSATYKTVIVMLNGKELETDVPAYRIEDKNGSEIYVPVSTIFRALGASVVWNVDLKQLSIDYEGVNYRLIVDKSTAYIDNAAKTMPGDRPVRLMKVSGVERTMIPVSFISTFMKMVPTWTPETRTLFLDEPLERVLGLNVNQNGYYEEIRVKVSAPIKLTHYTLDATAFGGKSKIVIEFQNAVIDAAVVKEMNAVSESIDKVVLLDPGKKPPKARLEIETKVPTGYDTWFDASTSEQVIRISNTVVHITTEIVDMKTAVSIQTAALPEYRTLDVNGKFVVDILDARLKTNSENGLVKVGRDGIASIAYSQFDGTELYGQGRLVTRVAVELQPGYSAGNVFVKNENQRLLIFADGDPNEGVVYQKITKDEATLEFLLNQAETIEKIWNPQLNELTFTIPFELKKFNGYYRNYFDNLTGYFLAFPQEQHQSTLFRIQLEQGVTYSDESSGNLFRLRFVNDSIRNSENQGKLIVVDPGHGGSSSGAVAAVSRVKESIMTLDFSSDLKLALEKEGYNVLMTREDDRFVGLYERTDIANGIEANAFISIHYNAFTNPFTKGVEVLYAPNTGEGNYDMAKSVYDGLVSRTGAIGRGVIQRPNLVVIRETVMPSILVELGFITNPQEEAQLQGKYFKRAQTYAIVEGVNRFMQDFYLKQ